MWQNTLISNSNIIIPRFDILVDMANVMKSCHVYRVDANAGILYGCNEEPYCIHALKIPQEFVPPISFSFRYDTINQEILKKYRNFALFESSPWALIPCENIPYAHDYMQIMRDGQWIIIDKTTGQQVEFLDLYGVDTDKALPVPYIANMLENRAKIVNRLDPVGSFFTDLQLQPAVQEVMSSKASIGRRYLMLEDTIKHKRYGFFVFKNLFNLNKDDKLNAIIRDRVDYPNLFEVEFILQRKKNPIQYIFHPYEERIITQFVGL